MDDEFIIRMYKPSDRQDVLRISADTAVFGEPVEAILDDRRIFCDAFTAYYITRISNLITSGWPAKTTRWWAT